jgi:hypothetical protein
MMTAPEKTSAHTLEIVADFLKPLLLGHRNGGSALQIPRGDHCGRDDGKPGDAVRRPRLDHDRDELLIPG